MLACCQVWIGLAIFLQLHSALTFLASKSLIKIPGGACVFVCVCLCVRVCVRMRMRNTAVCLVFTCSHGYGDVLFRVKDVYIAQ